MEELLVKANADVVAIESCWESANDTVPVAHTLDLSDKDATVARHPILGEAETVARLTALAEDTKAVARRLMLADTATESVRTSAIADEAEAVS